MVYGLWPSHAMGIQTSWLISIPYGLTILISKDGRIKRLFTISHTYIHTLHTITYHYIPLHTITYHYIPLHTITYRYIPLHTITYHYIPLHTITYHYIPLHTITYHYIPLHTITYITLHYIHTYI